MHLPADPFSIIQAVTACGVIVRDAADEEIVAANGAAAELLDIPLSLLLHHQKPPHWPRLLRPDGSALAWEEWPSVVALRTGQAQRKVRVHVVHQDGRRRTLCVDAMPVRRDDGALGWVVVSLLEVSEEAEESGSGSQSPVVQCSLG